MARSPLLPVGHHFVAGLLMLTASTGCIDAVSYLALDKVFTGNMTGNVLFIGFSLVGAGNTPSSTTSSRCSGSLWLNRGGESSADPRRRDFPVRAGRY